MYFTFFENLKFLSYWIQCLLVLFKIDMIFLIYFQSEEFIPDNIDDPDITIKEDEIIYFKARKIVPRNELKLGMER